MARPKAQINAKQVQKLAADGNKLHDIADFFGVSHDTIERRFASDLIKGRANRNIDLRKAQILAAKQGNSTMLVWLGKQYLGQTDSMIDQYLLDAIKEAGLNKNDIIDLIRNKNVMEAAKPKKSFTEFCETAGYPLPYPKQEEMRAFAMDETDPRLLLGSRGYGKTDYAVILGVAYEVYLDPMAETNLLITKSRERNAAMLNEIENACVKNGMTFELANSTSLRVSGLQGKDHSVSAVTIKTVTLRGRHPKRVIMDDPVTEDDTSEATRLLVEKKWNEVNKLCSNVLIPVSMSFIQLLGILPGIAR